MTSAVRSKVHNRGVAPVAFIREMAAWARTAPADIFARTTTVGVRDIYNKVFAELGPYRDATHRKAVMLEVMRVLAGFEASWDWTEGVDTSRLGVTTPENAEAGAWQVSYDARHTNKKLSVLLANNAITNGIKFQQAMKFNRPLAMEFVARLMRENTRHNGPLYKGEERNAIRKSLRGSVHSIYPWVRRESVKELESLIT